MLLHTYIDHTLLRPDATRAEIRAVCEETLFYHFASACLLPRWAEYARSILQRATLCCVVGFPLGGNTTSIKTAEAKELITIGVDELDVVCSVGALKDREYEYFRRDLRAVVDVAEGATVKAIIETCLLTDDEKQTASLLCMEAGASFVKTSTGFSKGGATVHDVELIRRTVGPAVGVKASGGIRDRTAALAMIEAGATRIGTSSSVALITPLKQ